MHGITGSNHGAKTQFMVKAPGFTSDSIGVKLPEQFILSITKESLDFEKMEDEKMIKIIQFPYQTIISWGHSSKNFQFKIFDDQKSMHSGSILLSLQTREGKSIEDLTMATVKDLMNDMEVRAISKEEFQTLSKEIFDEDGQLNEGWLSVIDQFTSTGMHYILG